jgi:uncharacterized Zn-binding protein involved in type VI secretion
MIPLARHGDTCVGVCTLHNSPIPMTGIVLATSAIASIDGLPAGLNGDIVIGNCGHTGTLVASSSVLFIEGKQAVRVGDSFVGGFSGTVVQGSAITSSL